MAFIEKKIAVVRIVPTWRARLRSLFRRTEYRVMIAYNRGEVDKIALYLNNDQLYSFVPDDD